MLNQDYKEMLQILQNQDVDFILVGAYALAAQGYPRSTLDIDIWVDPTKENSMKVFKALSEFGAPLEKIGPNSFEQNGIMFQIGVAPCRIDIITEISGDIDFQSARNRAKQVIIEDISLNILSIEDLIKNKEATGRPKDVEDANRLKNRMSAS
jgi:predicted nucleotidyltransferase